MLSDERLAEIEALARKATPGTWVRDTALDGEMLPDGTGSCGGYCETKDIIAITEDGEIEADIAHFFRAEDAAFAQECGPKTVLAMVDDVRRLRHERNELGKAIAEAAHKAGVYSGEVSLTGPDLILLCQDMAEYARRQDRDIEFLARIASAAERVVRLRGWSEVTERTPPVLGEAERELVRLVEEWRQ